MAFIVSAHVGKCDTCDFEGGLAPTSMARSVCFKCFCENAECARCELCDTFLGISWGGEVSHCCASCYEMLNEKQEQSKRSSLLVKAEKKKRSRK